MSEIYLELRLHRTAHLSTQTSISLPESACVLPRLAGSPKRESDLLLLYIPDWFVWTISHGNRDVAQNSLTVFACDVAVVVEVDQIEHNAHLLLQIAEVKQPHAFAELLQ